MKRLLAFSLIGIPGAAAIIAIGPGQGANLATGFIHLLVYGIALILVIGLALIVKGAHK
jgi:hypothetical protein